MRMTTVLNKVLNIQGLWVRGLKLTPEKSELSRRTTLAHQPVWRMRAQSPASPRSHLAILAPPGLLGPKDASALRHLARALSALAPVSSSVHPKKVKESRSENQFT